jgi:DNA polymerase III sliding clamp (beta) subunit (PCNA family)
MIQILRKDLEQVLGTVGPYVGKEKSAPVAMLIHFNIDSERATLTATDYQRSIRTHTAVDRDPKRAPVRFLVDAKALTGVVPRLSGDVVEMEIKGSHLHLNKGKVKLAIQDADRFPDVAIETAPDNMVIGFEADVLQEFSKAALFGTVEDALAANTPYQNVVKVWVGDDSFRAIATDSKRIAVLTGAAVSIIPTETQLPVAALKLFARTLKAGSTVMFGEDHNHIFVTHGDERYSFRKLAVDFPDVDTHLKRVTFGNEIRLDDADAAIAALELVSQVVDSTTGAMTWDVTSGRVVFSAANDTGDIQESIEVEGELDGDPFTARYNVHQILPILRMFSGDVTFQFRRDEQYVAAGGPVRWPMRVIVGGEHIRAEIHIQSLVV